MSKAIQITWTSGSLEEARKVARFLVQERLVACAQIVPWIESVYMWDNKLETEQESKVVLKTRLDRFEAVREVILNNCKYEVPEITWIEIDGGSEEYLNWINESTPSVAKV